MNFFIYCRRTLVTLCIDSLESMQYINSLECASRTVLKTFPFRSSALELFKLRMCTTLRQLCIQWAVAKLHSQLPYDLRILTVKRRKYSIRVWVETEQRIGAMRNSESFPAMWFCAAWLTYVNLRSAQKWRQQLWRNIASRCASVCKFMRFVVGACRILLRDSAVQGSFDKHSTLMHINDHNIFPPSRFHYRGTTRRLRFLPYTTNISRFPTKRYFFLIYMAYESGVEIPVP